MIENKMAEQFVALVREAGFGASIEFLLSEVRTCVYIFNSEEPDRIGGSRMGGMPDLPETMRWPAGKDKDGNPLGHADFLAQLDLSEIPRIENLRLPNHGHLWFFVEALWNANGLVHVIGAAEETPTVLHRRLVDRGNQGAIEKLTSGVTSLRFEIGLSLPFGNRKFRADLYSFVQKPWELLAEAIERRGHQGQIGGFAYTWNGDDLVREVAMTQLDKRDYREADRLLHTTYFDRQSAVPYTPIKPNAYFESMREKIEWVAENQSYIAEESAMWRLLAQFRPNIKIDFSLGDSYPLWIFIRENDLAASNFVNLISEGTA